MNENKTNINWYPGHMARTKKELKENIKLVDIVYEVIDARMPISSKIIDIDYIVKEKPKILVVTKYDLCDKKETDSLLKKYADTGYNIVACDLMKNIGIKQILDETKKISKKINDDRSKKGLKPRKIRALVVGAPNVGKSTLINRLVGRRATVVGNRPGVTQNLSWIRINDDVELLDSPGILWPKLENQEHAHNLAALSSIKEEIIDKEDIAKYIIDKLSCYYPDKLMKRYSLEKIDLDTIFSDIAEKRGVLKKGGITDYDKVYSIIIRDLKDGLFGNITFDR